MRKWAGAGLLAASVLLIGTAVVAETKPPTAPAPKGTKWEGPDLDASKTRTPAKGKSFSVPEVDDEVLVRSKRKGQ